MVVCNERVVVCMKCSCAVEIENKSLQFVSVEVQEKDVGFL